MDDIYVLHYFWCLTSSDYESLRWYIYDMFEGFGRLLGCFGHFLHLCRHQLFFFTRCRCHPLHRWYFPVHYWRKLLKWNGSCSNHKNVHRLPRRTIQPRHYFTIHCFLKFTFYDIFSIMKFTLSHKYNTHLLT